MVNLGNAALLVALATAVYAVGAFIVHARTGQQRFFVSGHRAVIALMVLLTLASFALVYLFVSDAFQVSYVYQNSASDQPLLYKISGWWASNEGSLLLWVWILSLFAFFAITFPPAEGKDMLSSVMAITMVVATFFLWLVNFVANPFELLPSTPAEGYGMNPLLQNPGMIIHPTTLYLGYVGFTIPYAYAMAALIYRRADAAWIRITRRWTLIAWLFLSIGIIYGAQWAYVELGWGGFWGWDPVENASLLPWLTGTAFFHSVMIQEKRGMLKVWNILLIIATFFLTLFGTFLTRSGVLKSVHAFGDYGLGYYFLAFMGIVLVVSLYVFFSRKHLLAEENTFQSAVSREASFLFNNLMLVGLAFAVFWGTVYPLISEAVTNKQVTVGPPFYNQVAVPIGVVLLILTGICPLIAWRKSSTRNLSRNFLIPLGAGVITFAVLHPAFRFNKPWAALAFASCTFVATTIFLEFYRATRVRRALTGEGWLGSFGNLLLRNRRRYGGYLVHLAVVVMIVGITGASAFDLEVEKSIKPGESINLGRYEMVYQGLGVDQRGRTEVVFADLVVTKDGRELGILRPSKEFHPNKEDQPTSEVAIMGSLFEDFYVILAGWESGGSVALFKVLVNPLIAWLWIGEYLLVAATVFTVWPERRVIAPSQAAVERAS